MESQYQKRLEEALSAYERQWENLERYKQDSGDAGNTVTSKRREVSVTVGRHGEVLDLSFPTSAYKRMAPAELAGVIVRAIGEAREKSIVDAAEALAPMLPPGLSAQELVRGEFDPRKLFDGQVPGLDGVEGGGS